jgi:hypothetical protein
VMCGDRPISAWVKVSPALTVLGPVNSTIGPRKPGRVLGLTILGSPGVHLLRSTGSARATLVYARYSRVARRDAIASPS